MTYAKTDWQNRVVEKPLTYTQIQNSDGSTTLIPAPGTIVQEGTPVNAANLNKMDYKLYDIDKGLEPQVTTGTADAFIAAIPESTALVTIIPHVDNEGNTTLNGLPIYDGEGLPVNSSDLKVNIPVQLIVRENCFFVASSGSAKGPELLKTQQAAFRFLPNYPVGVAYSCAACVGNYLYVFGGGGGSAVKELRRMHLKTLQWEPPTIIPYYCLRSSCVVYEDKIYLVGGATEPGLSVYNLSRGIVMYDPATGVYTTKAQNPNNVDMQHNSAVLIGQYIYVFSGMNGSRYNITDDTWTTLAAPAYTISSNPTLNFEEHIYFFGTGGKTTNYMRYDINTNTYTTVMANLPGFVIGGGGISMGTVGYLLGGASSPYNRVYKFDFLKGDVVRAGDLSYPCSYSAFATDGTWFYAIGSTVSSYEYMTGMFRPTMDKWYLPSGISISPIETFCLADGGDYVKDLGSRSLKITKPGHFLLAPDAILTMKKGSSVLYANTLKSSMRLTRLPDLPLLSWDSTDALIGDEWYIFGMSTLGESMGWNKACKYNIRTQEFTLLADAPKAIRYSCAIYDGADKIHLFGSNTEMSLHLIYNIITNTYTLGTQMPMNNYSISGGSKPPILHLYCGQYANTLYYKYNIETDTYTRATSQVLYSNSAYGGPNTAQYEDSLIIVGYSTSYYLYRVSLTTGFAQVYNIVGTLGSYESCGCVCEGKAYYLGGSKTPQDIYSRDLWIEDNNINQMVGFLRVKLKNAVAAAHGSRIYMAGGEDLSGTTVNNFLYELIPDVEQLFVNGKTFYAGVLLDGYGLQDVDQYRDRL